MSGTNWETQGARARAADKEAVDSSATRALTALAVGLLLAAALTFGLPLMVPHETAIGDAPLRALSTVEIVVGTVIAATGVVVLAIRIATGVILQAIARPATSGR